MYATVRRYDGIDKVRSEEITSKVGDSLQPALSKLPGFGAYYLIVAGEGVLTSIGLFEDASQAHESTRIAARWVREQKLESALPNTPKDHRWPGGRPRGAWCCGHERQTGARRALRELRHTKRAQSGTDSKNCSGGFHESAAAW